MVEQRLDRIEELLTQLIKMTAENNNIVKNVGRMDRLDHRMDRLEQRMDGFEQQFVEEKQLNAQRHLETLKEIRHFSFEIDYLRNQSAKHDMEIHVLKQT